MKKLIIVGTGVKFFSHLSLEVKSAIEGSDHVLYLVNEPAMMQWIVENTKSSRSLDDIYFSSESRKESYKKISDEVIKELNVYDSLCFVTYGNPLFLADSTNEVAGYVSRDVPNLELIVMPGISSLDCLFCDLKVDPGHMGMQAYEATDFILYDRYFSIESHLILFQVGVIGNKMIVGNNKNKSADRINIALEFLQNKLMEKYSKEHDLILYVASQYPGSKPEIIHVPLSELNCTDINRLATLYIPPLSKRKINKQVQAALLSS